MTNIKDEVFVRPGLTADNTDSVTNLTNIELNRLEDAFGELNLNVDDFMTKYKFNAIRLSMDLDLMLKDGTHSYIKDDPNKNLTSLEYMD